MKNHWRKYNGRFRCGAYTRIHAKTYHLIDGTCMIEEVTCKHCLRLIESDLRKAKEAVK